MSEEFDQLLESAKHWAAKHRDAGWLESGRVDRLLALENRSPASLFEPGVHRPLVAAFFGGTGVGKSSLLNRLARQNIARVGVERPTSREVSVYLHESLQIRQLPPGFPVDRVRVARHGDESRRQILWIDMPDIDSTEASNRDLVVDWLPHIDVLIYVVSPERYRDDKGWRLLRQHVREHAWLFVMNQWDLGLEPQYQDFVKLLRQGGFADPLIFRTDCREEAELRSRDEFVELEATLQSMAKSHLIEQLERQAREVRRDEIRRAVSDCLAGLGETSALEDLREQWEIIWKETTESLSSGLKWPIREVARAFVTHDASPLRRSIKLEAAEKGIEAKAGKTISSSILWDDWAQMQLQDALDRLAVEAAERGLPVIPLKTGASRVAEGAGKLLANEAQRALRQSLANPGNVAQRILLKLMGFFAVILPLAAMGWVSWQAVTAYYESALRHAGFLGIDFAIHSGLLVAIAWLLPFFIRQKLKPSHERAAVRGLRHGVGGGLARIGGLVVDVLHGYASELAKIREEGENLLGSGPEPAKMNDEILRRMMQEK